VTRERRFNTAHESGAAAERRRKAKFGRMLETFHDKSRSILEKSLSSLAQIAELVDQ
jgi:hypothetical protein